MARSGLKSLVSHRSTGARSCQEDYLLFDEDRGVYVVSDGFGGPQSGAQASRLACESVIEFLSRQAGDMEATLPFVLRKYYSLAGNVLFNALMYANHKILEKNDGKSGHEKGGASIVAGFTEGNIFAFANAGGCSAWLFRGGEAQEIAIPRTFSRMKYPFEKNPRKGQDIPLMALGIGDDLEPEVFEVEFQEGDWIFLQSDGYSAGIREALGDLQFQFSAGESIEGADLSQRTQELLQAAQTEENAAGIVLIF